MTSTFLVKLDHGDDTDLVGIASDIQETLSLHSQFDVLSVVPWTHPTLESTALLTPPVVPGSQ